MKLQYQNSLSLEVLGGTAPNSEVDKPLAIGLLAEGNLQLHFGDNDQHKLGGTAAVLMGADNQEDNSPGLPVTGPLYWGLHDRAPSNLGSPNFFIPKLYLSYRYQPNPEENPIANVYVGIRPFNEQTLTFEYPSLLSGIFTNATFAAPGLPKHSYVLGADVLIKGVLGLAFQAGTQDGFEVNRENPLIFAGEASVQGPLFGENHTSTAKAYISSQDTMNSYGVFLGQRSKTPIGEIDGSFGYGIRHEAEDQISALNAAVSYQPNESNFAFAAGVGHASSKDSDETLLDIGVKYEVEKAVGNLTPFVGFNFVHGSSSNPEVPNQWLAGLTAGFTVATEGDL